MINQASQTKDGKLLQKISKMKRLREAHEPIGYAARRAYEGKPPAVWNRAMGRLIELKRERPENQNLPEVAKQVDAFTNFLLSTDFIYTLEPSRLSDEEALRDSIALSGLAKDMSDQIKNSTVSADFVHYAVLDNVSFLEVVANPKTKRCEYHAREFYDVLFDPRIKKWEDQRLVVKIVRMQLDDLKESPLYQVPKDYKGSGVGGDWTTWKDIFEQEKYSSFATLHDGETIAFECHILDPEKGLTIRTIDAAGVVLRNDSYPAVKSIGLVPLRIYPGEWFQNSFAYRQIPINQTINRVANRLDDMLTKASKGGWIIQEDEEINGAMTDEVGQVIRYEAKKPEQIRSENIPQFFMDMFSTNLGMADRYGLSSILSGNMPEKASGLRAGKMIDQLTGLAQQGNASIINNFLAAYREVLRISFQFYYHMWDTPQDVLSSFNTDEKTPQFISEKYVQLYKDMNVVGVPGNFKRFDTVLDNALGYTITERRQMALELLKVQDENGRPLISGQVVRKMFALGSSGYLMEAEISPMYKTKEFQGLVQDFRSGAMNDEQKRGFISMLNRLSGQGGMPQQTPTVGQGPRPQQLPNVG